MRFTKNSIYCIIIILLSAATSFSQEIKIISAEDGTPLPFASVFNLTHPSFVSANAFGVAKLSVANGDSVTVSYTGCNSVSFVYNSNTISTIRLSKANGILPPVTVVNCKKMKKMKFKNQDAVKFGTMKNGTKVSFGGIMWFKEWRTPIRAIRINPGKENAILTSFSFWLQNSYNAPSSAIKALLMISFYEVSDSLLPGNTITETPLIYYPQKTGKQTLELDSLHLRIPSNGFYISFQYVMNEAYEWKETIQFKDSSNHIDSVRIFTGHGGRIEGLYGKEVELADFNPLKNKWTFIKNAGAGDGWYGTIKYEAIVKYCED
jgi:hypothetical protein